MKKYRNLLLSVFGSAALFLVLLGAGVYWCGGVKPFLAFVNGQSLYLSPRVLDLGSREAGTETVAIFRMTNLALKDISIVGEQSSCDCAFSEKIPITIPAGKTVDMRVNVHLPEYDTSYDQTVIFMVAEPDKLSMYPVQITATIPNPLPCPIEELEPSVPLPKNDQNIKTVIGIPRYIN